MVVVVEVVKVVTEKSKIRPHDELYLIPKLKRTESDDQ